MNNGELIIFLVIIHRIFLSVSNFFFIVILKKRKILIASNSFVIAFYNFRKLSKFLNFNYIFLIAFILYLLYLFIFFFSLIDIYENHIIEYKI